MQSRRLALCAALIATCATLNLALAQDGGAPKPTTMPTAASPVAGPLTVRSQHATASLLAEGKSFVPGKPFTVAILFACDPKWHVYWKDPGDSGLPPSVKWTLPPGWTAGEIQHPAPEVLKGPAGVNFVHEGEVALLVELTPPADAGTGEPVTIVGDLRWLECDADQCLTARGRVSAVVTASGSVEPNEPARFQAWRDAVKKGESFDAKAARGG